MGNILLGWPNRCDDAILSGGSWSAALPLTNLQTRQITQVARSINALPSSTRFLADLGQARILRSVALANHNLSGSASWRIKLGTSSGAADVYDSGSLSAWQLTFDTDTLEWADDGWWEGVTDLDAIGAPYLAVHVFTQKTAQYLTVEITDSGNSDGYVQIGRLFVSGGFQPEINPHHSGYADSWEDLSTIVESDSGAEFYTSRRRRRTVQFSLSVLTSVEAATVHELMRRAGTTGEVLYVQDSSDAEIQQRYGILGRLRRLSPIEWPYYNTRSVAFEIQEIL